ncbi:MAG: response regulator [Marinobacterium sp.]|nr:response regulator [Marinobacterium sp.]
MDEQTMQQADVTDIAVTRTVVTETVTMEKPSVLIVDDTPENIDVLKGVLADDYRIRVATNGRIALQIAAKQMPDIILLDVMMPEMDGYEVCRQLKENPVTAAIPVIFVTAMNEARDEARGLSLGAVDYISKPISAAIVQARVRTQLVVANQRKLCEQQVRERTHELEQVQRAAIFMLGEAGHHNDTDTGLHIWRMAAYAAALARHAGWSESRVQLLELAAPMHDTGKIGIPDPILKAPRKLTPEEWVVMKTHSMIGYQILSKSDTPLFSLAAEIALHHHERWDGTGYPNGLAGKDIPESARIVAIADVFDALTMNRPYKDAFPIDKAVAIIHEGTGSHFEPALIELFDTHLDELLAIKQLWDQKETVL